MATFRRSPQESLELVVPDRRRRQPHPLGEQLEKSAQAFVIERGRGLNDLRRRVAVARLKDTGELIREVGWQGMHRTAV